MQSDVLGSILRNLMFSGPTIVLCVLGIIFALVQREKAPKAATIVVISLVVLLLLMIVRPIGFSLQGRFEGDTRMLFVQIWSFLCSMVGLACTAALIFAVFCDRAAAVGSSNPFAKEFAPMPAPPSAPAPLPPFGGLPRPPQ